METLWLTIGTLGFAAATVYFLSLMNGAPEGSRYFFIITAAITGVAANASRRRCDASSGRPSGVPASTTRPGAFTALVSVA